MNPSPMDITASKRWIGQPSARSHGDFQRTKLMQELTNALERAKEKDRRKHEE